MENEIKKISAPDMNTVKVKKLNWKIRGLIYTLTFCLLVLGFYQSLIAVNNFFSVNFLKFNRPIEIRINKPIEILNREEVKKQESLNKKFDDFAKKAADQYIQEQLGTYGLETPTPSKPASRAGLVVEAKAAEKSNIDIYMDFIYWRESHRDDLNMPGLHRTCLAKGKWNGYGYLPEPGFCFESKEVGMETLRKELTERLAVNNEVEVLCVYNLGPQKDEQGKRIPYLNCGYYQSYLEFKQSKK